MRHHRREGPMRWAALTLTPSGPRTVRRPRVRHRRHRRARVAISAGPHVQHYSALPSGTAHCPSAEHRSSALLRTRALLRNALGGAWPSMLQANKPGVSGHGCMRGCCKARSRTRGPRCTPTADTSGGYKQTGYEQTCISGHASSGRPSGRKLSRKAAVPSACHTAPPHSDSAKQILRLGLPTEGDRGRPTLSLLRVEVRRRGCTTGAQSEAVPTQPKSTQRGLKKKTDGWLVFLHEPLLEPLLEPCMVFFLSPRSTETSNERNHPREPSQGTISNHGVNHGVNRAPLPRRIHPTINPTRSPNQTPPTLGDASIL